MLKSSYIYGFLSKRSVHEKNAFAAGLVNQLKRGNVQATFEELQIRHLLASYNLWFSAELQQRNTG